MDDKDLLNELNELMKKSEGADKTSSDQYTSDKLTPAWGGARKQGSVPVPLEFENITSLGPATAVYGNNDKIGLFYNNMGWTLGNQEPKRLVLYRDGLAYKAGNESIQIWGWDEITIIATNADSERTRRPFYSYTLTRKSGETLVLDETLQNVEDFMPSVKRSVFALLLPPLKASYMSGQAIAFGSVTIHHRDGLQMGGKTHLWEDIMDIKVRRGRFKVILRNGEEYEVRASSIPNIEMLCNVIGLKLNQADLSYY